MLDYTYPHTRSDGSKIHHDDRDISPENQERIAALTSAKTELDALSERFRASDVPEIRDLSNAMHDIWHDTCAGALANAED